MQLPIKSYCISYTTIINTRLLNSAISTCQGNFVIFKRSFFPFVLTLAEKVERTSPQERSNFKLTEMHYGFNRPVKGNFIFHLQLHELLTHTRLISKCNICKQKDVNLFAPQYQKALSLHSTRYHLKGVFYNVNKTKVYKVSFMASLSLLPSPH